MDSENVVPFPGSYIVSEDNDTPNLPSEGVAQGIIDNELKEVFVVGIDPEGELYIASNVPSLSKIVYYIELAKQRLLSNDFEHHY